MGRFCGDPNGCAVIGSSPTRALPPQVCHLPAFFRTGDQALRECGSRNTSTELCCSFALPWKQREKQLQQKKASVNPAGPRGASAFPAPVILTHIRNITHHPSTGGGGIHPSIHPGLQTLTLMAEWRETIKASACCCLAAGRRVSVPWVGGFSSA